MGHVGGKLLLFQAALPTLGAGKLKPGRDNPHLYNSEREPSLRNPEDPFFKRYAGEASSRQMTLDVFLAANGFADLASLAAIPRYTCGQVSGGRGGGAGCVQPAPSTASCASEGRGLAGQGHVHYEPRPYIWFSPLVSRPTTDTVHRSRGCSPRSRLPSSSCCPAYVQHACCCCVWM
jgi:hypothetical protein